MQKQGLKAAICAGLTLAAGPLAAQSAMPRAASDSIEVEVTSAGSVKVPAQGFRFSVFLPQQIREAALDRAEITRRLKALGTIDREVCSPSYPLGFIGNELLAEEEPFDEGLAPASAPVEGAESVGIALNPEDVSPFPFVGVLPSAAAVETAKAILAEYGLKPMIVQPVLFECVAANEQAKFDALASSADEAAILARALGMHVGGVTQIADAEGSEFVAFSAFRMSHDAGDGTVTVQAALRVTYRLDK